MINRPQELTFIKSIHNTFHMTLTKYYKDKAANVKIPQYIIPPLLTDLTLYKKNFNIESPKYDFCVVGTLSLRSYIKGILHSFVNSEYTIIIAGKIMYKWREECSQLRNQYADCKNIYFNLKNNGITEKESTEIILNSRFGIRIDKPVECLSAKVLNYICYNRIPIVQKIETHKLLLTEQYPFFLDIDPNKSSICLDLILKDITEEKIQLALELVNKAKEKLDVNKLLENNFTIN